MVKLHCTVPSDPFPFLSLDGLHFFSFWAVWLPAPGAVVPDAWLGSTPPTNSPYTQGLDVLLVMFFQYTVILPDSQALLQSHHLHILYLLLPLSNSTLIFSLLTSITVSHQLSLQNNFTSAAMLPILFFFLSETVDFLLSLDIVTSLSTHKMPSSSIPLSSASITHPVCSSQYPAPPELYVC